MAEHLASIFGTEKDRVNCPFYFKIGACRHGDRCSRLHNKPTLSQTLHFANMYQHPENVRAAGRRGCASYHGTNGPLLTCMDAQVTDPGQAQEHFEDFYEDVFEELSKYGEVESLNVCDYLVRLPHPSSHSRLNMVFPAQSPSTQRLQDLPAKYFASLTREVVDDQADHMVGSVYAKFYEEDSAAAALQALSGRYYAGRPIIVEFSPVTDFREATCRQYEENTCNRGGYCNFMHLKPVSR